MKSKSTSVKKNSDPILNKIKILDTNVFLSDPRALFSYPREVLVIPISVIEEIDEPAYKIDRMIVQLKRAGKLSKLAGLVVGYMTDIKEGELPFGESAHQIILNHVMEFNYPVAFNFPIGHENPNLAWIEGKETLLNVTKNKATLKHIEF